MSLVIRGALQGHNGIVTSIAVPEPVPGSDYTNAGQTILSTGRDRSVIQWDLSARSEDPFEYGRALKGLRGHSHFVQDVAVSRDGQFALSASWDRSLRLWDLNFGKTEKVFTGHTGDVMSVAFSPDNRQIVSGGRDRSVRLWNTVGECKCVIDESSHQYPHTDWVSSVKFSPNPHNPLVISGSWDKTIKIWNITKTFNLKATLVGHTGYINNVAISPDGTLCASGGKDGTVMLWDLNEEKHLYSLDGGDIINSLTFSPNRFWLCAGTDSGIKVFDLQSKTTVATLDKQSDPDFHPANDNINPGCTALSWSHDGNVLFAGYTDGLIRVWSAGGQGH
eukprot:TRINITY_DN105_c0_g1_i2.p1 TRINITY_DN105_c0_g1~~TRINITY_DN105_c0_g1_i2.p1  ORF type:complete len:335 (-),score=83.59 TRINITY_DN105_c0_g1_i2:189-1193(-)